MSRASRFFLLGSAVLITLAGCGRGFFQFQEREAWRHEAEVQCLKSGAVRESSTLVRVSPIEGPGICGADFPLKVVALGESPAMAFAQDVRPPGAIPNGASAPRWPGTQPSRYVPPADVYSRAPPLTQPAPPSHGGAYPSAPVTGSYTPTPNHYSTPGAPLSLNAPGINDVLEAEEFEEPSYAPDRQAHPPARSPDVPRSYAPRRGAYAPAAPPIPLGTDRGPQYTGSAVPVEVKPAATLACPIVSALDQWIAGSVQPAAMRWFGQPVVEIKQISAYSCRGMNGQPGARISEHAFGNALDIAAFTLADGRKVIVRTAWNGLPEEQGFLRDIQGKACDQFTTVLAPGSNRFHYDHIHVDLMRRDSGRRICEPGAIPGEVAAARAAQRNGYARRQDSGITGSVRSKRTASPMVEQEDEYAFSEPPPRH